MESTVNLATVSPDKRDVMINMYCDLLAGRARRADRLPKYSPEESDTRPGNLFARPFNWMRAHKQLGSDGRAIMAAVAHDVEEVDRVGISDMLGLRDHEIPAAADAPNARPSLHTLGAMVTHGEANKAGRYIRRGRSLLETLGAWPWAYLPTTRWPSDWEQDPAVRKPLEDWQQDALRMALTTAKRAHGASRSI